MCGLVTDARNQQSVERVVEQTSLILLTTVQAKCLHADDACDGGLHAQTDRDASLLISQIVSPLPKYGFCVLLKSLHCSQYLIVQSQERRGTVSWALTRTDCGNEKKFWIQTDCSQANTGHTVQCPLLVARPNMYNARLPKQPPANTSHRCPCLSHLSFDPLKPVKRGKDGIKCRSNVRIDFLQTAHTVQSSSSVQ